MLGIPCILAVVFGDIALNQTKSGKVGGRGMAIAGLVLGYICVIPMIILTFVVFGLFFGAAGAAGTAGLSQ